MTHLERLKKLPADPGLLGLSPAQAPIAYFCTPRGARIFAVAGVDGIHFCTVRGFGEMIFAVNPANQPGQQVHAIARDFKDLMRLLLACGSMDAVEQAFLWTEAAFAAYVRENAPDPAQAKALAAIEKHLGICPMDQPYQYIQTLSQTVDLSKLRFTEDYYDRDMNPQAPLEPRAWKVTAGGSFWSRKGRNGCEIAVQKSFDWGGDSVWIPAIYTFSTGMVVDLCIQRDIDAVRAFIEKYDLLEQDGRDLSAAERLLIEAENPLDLSFSLGALVNGRELKSKNATGMAWVPRELLGSALQVETETEEVLLHYGLDAKVPWIFRRVSLPWATQRKPKLSSVKLQFRRRKKTLPGPTFSAEKAGDKFSFIHPLHHTEHCLTVLDLQEDRISPSLFHDRDLLYPTEFRTMTYTLAPDLDGGRFRLQDRSSGDSPRPKATQPGPFGPAATSSVGIIGGADGPTALILGKQEAPPVHVACSSLFFERPASTCWQITFHEKLVEDITVDLL